MDSRFVSWQKFCAESDKQVSGFNSKPQKRCPFCGGEASMYWKSTDYDNFFIIECKKCEARVKEYSFDEAVKLWNKRAVDENATAIIKELADALEIASPLANRDSCSDCAIREECNNRKTYPRQCLAQVRFNALIAKAREVVK